MLKEQCLEVNTGLLVIGESAVHIEIWERLMNPKTLPPLPTSKMTSSA